MPVTDYIAIRGFSASTTEVFQGIGAGAPAETTKPTNRDPGVPDVYEPPITATPLSEDPELAKGIWEGQNAKIRSESAYCDQLQKEFDKKYRRLGAVADKLKDIFQEILGAFLGELVEKAVTLKFGPVAGWFAGIATELGLEWGIDALINLLVRGNELLEGIKDENNKILEIEQSRENYDYREKILARHREDIKIVLEQIRMAEKNLELQTQLEMKELLERLTDLALRDDTIELGNMRLHSKGRVVNF